MIRLARILLPSDFSELSSEATKYACGLAEQFAAELHVLHVQESLIVPEYGLAIDWTELMQEAKKSADAKIRSILGPEWSEGRAVVTAVVEGTPFVEIIRYAREHAIDLIVMGTHGRSGVAHMLMGSVAEKVVRKSPCPVLTVRPVGHQFVMP
ncbi:MAG: universal stress protein [Rhodopirellula sp.]|nr:universal stress protein [Rhodopirellula sp.]